MHPGLEGCAGAGVAVGDLLVSSGSTLTLSVCGFWAFLDFALLQQNEAAKGGGSWLLQEETLTASKGHGERMLWGRDHRAMGRQSKAVGWQPTHRV